MNSEAYVQFNKEITAIQKIVWHFVNVSRFIKKKRTTIAVLLVTLRVRIRNLEILMASLLVFGR